MTSDEEDLKRYREHLNKILDSGSDQIARIYPVVIPDGRNYQYPWCKRSIGGKEDDID